jgi:hypothetical protein
LTVQTEDIIDCHYLKQENDKQKGLVHFFAIKVKSLVQQPSIWLEKQTSYLFIYLGFHKREQQSLELYASINHDPVANILYHHEQKTSSSKKEGKKAKKILLLNSVDQLKESSNFNKGFYKVKHRKK